MKFELTKEQNKHVQSLQWLFTGPRGSGRTTLLAYVLIQTVLETGVSQRIVDHHPDKRADQLLAREIEVIIGENDLPLAVNRVALTLSMRAT